MFENNNKEYMDAIKEAQIHVYQEKKGMSSKFIVINVLLFSIVLALSYFYFKHNGPHFNEPLKVQKVAVLGVSHTSSKSEYSDDELVSILEKTDIDEIALNKADNNYQVDLGIAMSELVKESENMVDLNYQEVVSKEVDDKNGFKGRVVVVKKGDTLSTLAQEYYGDANAYHKIIDYNINLSETSHTLYVGEKINIPY